jgi:pimeloyl-ACP methyl ester carboxylesterase
MARTLFASWGSWFGAVAALLVGGAASASAASAAPVIPRFESAPCGFKDVPEDWPAKNGLTCGWVTVKAHRDWPDSATLRLWVFKMAAIDRSKGLQPPLIRMVGGPEPAGVTPTSPRSPTNDLILRLRADRDVIYFDYRGLDKSEPALACKVAPVTGATLDARWRSKLGQYADCRRQIDAAGTDFGAVGATVGAQDVEDIAQALGYRTYALWGSSYGTFPELYLVGRRPAGLRAAIVGVTFPPDTRNIEQFSTFGQGLTAMQRECDRNAPCHARFPDMAGSLRRAMDRLDRERLMGHSRRLTPADLYQSLFNMSTDPDSLALVPLAISVAEKADAKLVAQWMDATKGEDLGLPEVTDPQIAGALATVCSTVPDPSSSEGAVKAAARRYPYLAKAIHPTDALKRVCEIWKTAPPPRDLRQPIHSDIPVLFYYARLDTAVLVSDTLRVAKSLPHSTVIEVPGVGHNFSDACLVDLYVAFLDNPTGVLDRSCTAQMKPITFALDGFEGYVTEVSKH